MEPTNQASILAAGQQLVPDYMTQQIQRQIGQGQVESMKQERLVRAAMLDEKARAQAEKDRFQEDLREVMTNPSADTYSRLILRNPEFATETKAAWELRDKAERQRDMTDMGGIYAAAANGRMDLAAAALERRITADRAAGHEDPQDAAILAALKSDDEAQQKAALGMIGVHLAAVTGPEHFGTVFGGLNKGKEGFTLDAGATRFDAEGNVVAHSPFVKGADGGVYDYESTLGGGSALSADLPAPQAAVAGVLSEGGMSPNVVAGFLGNFDVEGGYDGAVGDGGTAHGIAQLRGERVTNFQRVIGKSPTDATHEEQARFVLWEMQNPEAAGMTTAQRDRILAAKSPQEAATLIDKFYERSSGKHRQRRVEAALRYAGGGGPRALLPGNTSSYRILSPEENAQRGLDPNTRYQENATTKQITPLGGQDTPSYRILSPQENGQRGLDPNVRYQENTKTGQITALGGQEKSQGRLKPVPHTRVSAIIENRSTLREIDRAIALLRARPGSIGLGTGALGDWFTQRNDPKGTPVRAALGKIGGKIIHDVSGAAVTLSEAPRFKPYVPAMTDTADTALKKLAQMRTLAAAEAGDLEAAWGPDNGYRGVSLPGKAPVKVRSVQEAQRLPKGTIFITPDGRRKVR